MAHQSHKPTDTDRRYEELSVLYEIARAVSFSSDLEKSLSDVLEILQRDLGMNRGTITVLNPATTELQIEVASGLSSREMRRGVYRVGEGITGRVVESGEPMVIPQVGKEPMFLDRTGSRKDINKDDISFICVPIKVGPRAIGALSVDRLFDRAVSLEEDVRLLTIISSIIAQAVRHMQMLEEEKARLISENVRLKGELKEKYSFENIIGSSNKMHQVYTMIDQVAKTPTTVLIRGESGTGKELVAHAIHYNSTRAAGPLIKVSLAALPETLLESELFGHERGAFTGALGRKAGRFQAANSGTIFLDEIGDLPLSLQVKLLRVLQEREFELVGGTETIRADVRIIAATNRNLEELMAEGRFREDLYFRLNVFPIYMPPLRERKTDIILLASHFVEKYASAAGRAPVRLTAQAADLLMGHPWPGNVRELENAIERAMILVTGDVITEAHLPPSIGGKKHTPSAAPAGGEASGSMEETVENLEREMIVSALEKTRGNRARAAALLGITPRMISYKIGKYGIDPEAFRG